MSDAKRPLITSAFPAGDYYDARPEIGVYSWSPEPPGTPHARVTQVHIHIVTDLGRAVMRVKSAERLDEIIDALVKHREDVWGKR